MAALSFLKKCVDYGVPQVAVATIVRLSEGATQMSADASERKFAAEVLIPLLPVLSNLVPQCPSDADRHVIKKLCEIIIAEKLEIMKRKTDKIDMVAILDTGLALGSTAELFLS